MQSLGLILLSAVFHCAWNILAKKAVDKITFLWLQLVFAVLLLAVPVLCILPLPDAKAIPFFLLSGGLQSAYYILLAKSYSAGDLSIVYPIMRGSAPLFVCLISLIFSLERITPSIIFAIAVIVTGLYIINLEKIDSKHLLAPIRAIVHDPPTRLSLINGLIIALYTISDGQAVRYSSPLWIYLIISVIPAIAMLPIVLKRSKLKEELARNKIRISAVSVLTFLAYLLVLIAMRQSSASYVSASREISIVFMAIYSTIILHEKHRLPKILGAAITFSGIIMLSIFRSL